jgi:putative transposase
VKKPHKYLSLVYPQSGWKLTNVREVGRGKNTDRKARLYLSKIGFFTLVIHREPPMGLVRQVCVKLNPSGKIFVVFLVGEPEEGQPEQVMPNEPKKAVAVDVGVARLATLSDGRFLENPRPLERYLYRIRVLQRSLSRKMKSSKNWFKAKRRLAKEYEHVKDFRRDLFFKLGALLAQEYDLLVLEELSVVGLIRRGETRRRLRLHDSSFSELRRILEWEFKKRGNAVLAVQAYNTSRECFLCGEINRGLTLGNRVFRCPHCGFTLDRDLNACLVLLKRSGWVPPPP